MYITIILPVVLFGFETVCHIRGRSTDWGCSIMVLRKMCGAKWEKGTGDWRKLCNGELLVLTKYFSSYQIQRMRLLTHVACMRETCIWDFSGKI